MRISDWSSDVCSSDLTDPKGKPKKIADPTTYELLKPIQKGQVDMSDEEIVDRHMLPMIIETARCLDDGIVETPTEADMGLIMGVGFPTFSGGALKYADTVGMQTILHKRSEDLSGGKESVSRCRTR